VFPLAFMDAFKDQDLLRWNEPRLWKHAYDESAASAFCFAEDIFGYQFCLRNDEVGRFDPETGGVEHLCSDLEEWADLVCSDYYAQTGYKIARDWQAARGAIQPGNRLVPIHPFITSAGTYELDNLYEGNAVAGMLSRADFARQVRSIPDDTQIRIVPTNLRGI
jgi:hypothetical protein